MRVQRSGFYAALALGQQQNLSLSKTESGILGWFQTLYDAAMAGNVHRFKRPSGRIQPKQLSAFARSHGFMVLPAKDNQMQIARGPVTFINGTSGPLTMTLNSDQAAVVEEHCADTNIPCSINRVGKNEFVASIRSEQRKAA